ncbi:hypothetical protein H632_c4822p0, partial [Helicosporidium sp. ATCC 50920]
MSVGSTPRAGEAADEASSFLEEPSVKEARPLRLETSSATGPGPASGAAAGASSSASGAAEAPPGVEARPYRDPSPEARGDPSVDNTATVGRQASPSFALWDIPFADEPFSEWVPVPPPHLDEPWSHDGKPELPPPPAPWADLSMAEVSARVAELLLQRLQKTPPFCQGQAPAALSPDE